MTRKSKKQTGSHGSNGVKRHFPRLLAGTEAAAIEKLIWKIPEFQARMGTDIRTIDFIFRLRLPRQLKRYQSLYWILFGPTAESWEKSFRSAYSRLRYGDKDLEQSIANPLHLLFLEGVRLWLQDAWSLKGIAKNTNKKPSRRTELEIFNKESRIKKNQPDPRVAMLTARRGRQFFTDVPALRTRLKDRAAFMELGQLRSEITKVLPYKIFLAGLRRIAPEPHPSPKAFFTASWVTETAMVEAMLTAELEMKGYSLKRISLKTYLKEGEKLLTALSFLPK
jgi:hypothetical protein